jgi:hypothetical protein
VAMWSGPRNISTALMRSFGARPDTLVVDEPLYAHYLAVTGTDHPGRAAVLASQPTRWEEVAAALTGPLPDGIGVYYQKHMAHHLLPEVGRDWLERLEHAFLIREPRAMLASLAQVRPTPALEETGLPQQVQLLGELRERNGRIPPIVDASELLADPEAMLRALCREIGLAFDPAMLSWEPGPRATDGCWAPHWYANAMRSTGFTPFPSQRASLPDRLEELCRACDELYAELHALRLRPD